jgi:tagatose-1,6-bisphosphate aldolase
MDSPFAPPVNSYARVISVTPSDTAPLANGTCAGFYANATGSLAFLDAFGNSASINVTIAGTIYPIRAKQILATGTTAGNIFVLY